MYLSVAGERTKTEFCIDVLSKRLRDQGDSVRSKYADVASSETWVSPIGLGVFSDDSLAACIHEANRLNTEHGYTSGIRVVECEDGHRITAADCKTAARPSL